MHLAALEPIDGYRVAYHSNAAASRFNAIEQTALHRHHRLLSFQAPTLSDYNRTAAVPQPYQLLLIHLEDYPDELASLKRLRAFFDAAFDAGYYSILFANRAITASDAPTTRYLLGRFPTISATDRAFDLGTLPDEALGGLLAELTPHPGQQPFEYLNDNKDRIVQTLLARRQHSDGDTADDFLSVPIGTTADGQTPVQ